MSTEKALRIALYEPDIPQNCGALMRVCAALDVGLDIIEPCGFILDDRKLKRAGMDYLDFLDRQHHFSWENFKENRHENRFILMTTKTDQDYTAFDFNQGDILIAGAESTGVPDHVHDEITHKVTIKMNSQARSINVANATSMILGEALRQVHKKGV